MAVPKIFIFLALGLCACGPARPHPAAGQQPPSPPSVGWHNQLRITSPSPSTLHIIALAGSLRIVGEGGVDTRYDGLLTAQHIPPTPLTQGLQQWWLLQPQVSGRSTTGPGVVSIGDRQWVYDGDPLLLRRLSGPWGQLHLYDYRWSDHLRGLFPHAGQLHTADEMVTFTLSPYQPLPAVSEDASPSATQAALGAGRR